MYVKTALPIATAFALWTAAANAQTAATDAIISQYSDMGFQHIEIYEGITQTKVEAIMSDGRKVEVIYDSSTGRILKQENGRADASELRLTGVEVEREGGDFLDDDEFEDDDRFDDDDDDDDDGYDDDDDDDDGYDDDGDDDDEDDGDDDDD
ncbi:MAG: PepSY domain-containing protein [Pseudomonadota bacterium]